MEDKKCRVCRRAGEKLFLKGEKCFTPKCVFNKKPYAPGKPLSERKHRSMLTEYGKQLKEKQKVRNIYGIREEQFAKYVREASARVGANPAEMLYARLEARLDNVVYRLGLAPSRSLARQLVSHGHITVNGRRMTIPSHKVTEGDSIAVRDGSKEKKVFTENVVRIQKADRPAWISFDEKGLAGKVVSAPKAERKDMPFDLAAVIEFYSR